jgi:bifunctional non-homologous end joining protein LigD
MEPIILTVLKEPFDNLDWTFELKFDGFKGIADTVRLLSENSNHMKRYNALLAGLPGGCVFNGEIVVLDRAGRPQFNAGQRSAPHASEKAWQDHVM